ncbi:hypothetical protein N8208_01895 [Planktomarina temperata]|nr:hypothetical protein [Planktomarina temperata]
MMASIKLAALERAIFIAVRGGFFIAWIAASDKNFIADFTQTTAWISLIIVVASFGSKGYLTISYRDKSHKQKYHKILHFRLAISFIIYILAILALLLLDYESFYFIIILQILLAPFELTHLKLQLEKQNYVILIIRIISSIFRIFLIILTFQNQSIQILVSINFILDSVVLLIYSILYGSQISPKRALITFSQKRLFLYLKGSFQYFLHAIQFVLLLRTLQFSSQFTTSDVVTRAEIGVATNAVNMVYPVFAGMIAASVPYAFENRFMTGKKFKRYYAGLISLLLLATFSYHLVETVKYRGFDVFFIFSISCGLLAVMTQNLIISKICIIEQRTTAYLFRSAIIIVLAMLGSAISSTYLEPKMSIISLVSLIAISSIVADKIIIQRKVDEHT